MTSLAQCCRPIPPDEIIGFVTRGRGVSVHRAACSNARALARRSPERVIDVTWGPAATAIQPEVFVLAQDRPGLLRDISEVFAREKAERAGREHAVRAGRGEDASSPSRFPDAAVTRRTLAQIGEVKGVLVARPSLNPQNGLR